MLYCCVRLMLYRQIVSSQSRFLHSSDWKAAPQARQFPRLVQRRHKPQRCSELDLFFLPKKRFDLSWAISPLCAAYEPDGADGTLSVASVTSEAGGGGDITIVRRGAKLIPRGEALELQVPPPLPSPY